MSLIGLSVNEARQQVTQQLSDAGIESAHAEAQQLLEAVLGLDRVGLLMRSAPLSEGEAAHLQEWGNRRIEREPLQHILGFVEWGGLRLEVSPDALIPRPETEVLLELAKAEVTRLAAPVRVLDVGTGTGALALALRAWLSEESIQAQVYASDISPQALIQARRNAQRLGLDIELIQSDLLHSVPTGLDLLLSNPPYLPASDEQHAQPEVTHDPPLALYSGTDGLELARKLMQQAPHHLNLGGVALLELDPRNVHTLAAELSTGQLGGAWQVEIHADLTGRERFLRVSLSSVVRNLCDQKANEVS